MPAHYTPAVDIGSLNHAPLIGQHTSTQRDALIDRLALGVLEHQHRVGRYHGLHEAVRKGQKPEYAIYDNGGSISGHALLGIPPAKAFCASCFLQVLPLQEHERNAIPGRTTIAAAEYAKLLKVKEHVMIFDNSAIDIKQLFNAEENVGPFINRWKKTLSPIVGRVKKSSAFMTGNATDLFRIVGQEVLSRNAANLEQMLGIKVIPLYYDAAAKMLTVYSHKSGDESLKVSGETLVDIPSYEVKEGFPRAVGCSCCDSRALHGHMYCAQPGEFLEINSIAALIPPHEQVLKLRQPHSLWGKIEYAYRVMNIREFSVTGHTQCGGIDALVKWCITGKSPGGYVGAWLDQIYPLVAEAVKLAEANGMFFDSPEKIRRLAEMRVAQWSAKNVKDYAPDAEVLALYLDIETREVYRLPEFGPVEKTAQCVVDFCNDRLPKITQTYAGPRPDFTGVSMKRENDARVRRRISIEKLIKASLTT